MADAAVAAYFAMARTWRPVSFVKSLSFKGGYQGHALPVESRVVEAAGGTLAFLKLEKRSEWPCKAVAGPKANIRDTLKRSRFFEELRANFFDLSTHLDQAAVAAELEIEDNDPMNALVSLGDEPGGSQRTGRKRNDLTIEPCTRPSAGSLQSLVSRCQSKSALAGLHVGERVM